MGIVGVGKPNPEGTTEDRLDSWKEIAAYLDRDVTTVQRWEKREGMPVHRHLHDKLGTVYASRSELDLWVERRRGAGTRALDEVVAVATPASRSFWQDWIQTWMFVLPAVVTLAVVILYWLNARDYFWRSPIASARFQTVTDFDSGAHAAAISRDGKFIAFLSDRGGRYDVWVTQVGSGQFHNLTGGSTAEILNPSIRNLQFSPDGSQVAYWARRSVGSKPEQIDIWAVPTLGGPPRVYLEGVAEFDWTKDGARLAYHTPGTGDPLYVTSGEVTPENHPIIKASEGLHSHFPTWSPDGKYIYFVQGSLPDKLDIWRVRPQNGTPERITSINTNVSYPVPLSDKTLLYLATDADGEGPWLYSVDLKRRATHRLNSGTDRYTSLSASADGRRFVATLATPKKTLWETSLSSGNKGISSPTQISLTTRAGFAPRLGPDFLIYVSEAGDGTSLWKLSKGFSTELWSGRGARLVGGPAISPGGDSVAFSVLQNGKKLMYVSRIDGTNMKILTDQLDLEGTPAWSPDGRTLTTGVRDNGTPRLFLIPLDGSSPIQLVREYSIDPAWSPGGGYVLYSGADVGTVFPVKSVSVDGMHYPVRPFTLTRGARRLVFLPGGQRVLFLKGEIRHKNLWVLDLVTGVEQQVTSFPPDFEIRDFDLSPDGKRIVLERVQERSDVVLIDRNGE